MADIEVKEFKGNRYAVYSKDGKLLDDAQGYGYKTKQKAYAAYAYKTRDKSKDAEKNARRNSIRKWLKTNPDICSTIEDTLFYAMKDGENVKITDVVKALLKEHPEVDFKPGEVVRVWERM